MLKQGTVGIETRKEKIAASPDEKLQLRRGGLMRVKNDQRNWPSRQYLAVRGRGS